MTPINQLLNSVDWKPEHIEAPAGSDAMPYATHSGVLEIGDMRLRCYRLSDGSAVFDTNDVNEFFGDFLRVAQ